MGPHPLWLMESLCNAMSPLQPGMRVLDMGCGKALTSVFLAREFGVEVWANDWWISASDNLKRIEAAGVADRVFPLHAEARALPYADHFFDAIVSVDAYHYFGTDDMYLRHHFARLVKPGGRIGIVVPGLVRDFENNGVPEHLQQIWQDDFYTFHTAAWWRRHWELRGPLKIELADNLPDGWRQWLIFNRAIDAARGRPGEETELLKGDAGRYLGFVRIVARASEPLTPR
jgi:cyclopropane fatty-acyl-phospholipid synthase-like methyltransferase